MKDDLFHPKNLLPAEGLQSYSVEEAKRGLKMISPRFRKQMCVVKDEKPDFIKDDSWRQTFSLANKKKVKIWGGKCL